MKSIMNLIEKIKKNLEPVTKILKKIKKNINKAINLYKEIKKNKKMKKINSIDLYIFFSHKINLYFSKIINLIIFSVSNEEKRVIRI